MSQLALLPNELLEAIFFMQLDPYKLFKQILTFRHISKYFYALTDDENGFWQVLINRLRNKDDLFEGSDSYFYTHAFLDRLLFKTHKYKFNGLTKEPVVYYTISEELVSYGEEEHDGSLNLFERFEEWINAYSKEKSLLLKAMIQACLGRDMGSHIGMCQVSALIALFFGKLFEPAVKFAESWDEKPKEIEWKDELIFDRNLLEIIEARSLFGEDITNCWSEFDNFYSCIPRNYILFMVDKFQGIGLQNDSNCSSLVLKIMKKLREYGIKVERMRFNDVGIKRNYEASEIFDRFIPKIAKWFCLQHLAVWINDKDLLEWCLTVGSNSDTTISSLSGNIDGLNVNLVAHVKTYIDDACGLTVLHYAVKKGNVEMCEILINKYLANPFVNSKIEHRGNSIDCFSICKIGEGNPEKSEILQILEGKYRSVSIMFDEIEKIKDVERASDLEKLQLERLHPKEMENFLDEELQEEGEESDSVEIEPKEELNNTKNVMKEFLIVEMANPTAEEYEKFEEYRESYSDDSENEFGLSYEWFVNDVGKQKSLKRMRNPQKDHDYNESLRKLSRPLEELELIEWNQSEYEYDDLKQWGFYNENDLDQFGFVKILKRKVDSFEQDEENIEQAEEKVEVNNTLGTEFILRKGLTIPKVAFDSLLYEVSQDYKTELFLMPNAKMFIQQGAEKLLSSNFSLAQDIANFCERDYIIETDVSLAASLISSTTNLDYYRIDREDLKAGNYENYLTETHDIYSGSVKTQLENLITDETILESLVNVIEGQFEIISNNLEDNNNQDDSSDEEYEIESDDSSEDETYYSDDSMISCLCIEQYYDEDGSNDVCYSAFGPQDYLTQRKDAVYFEHPDYLSIHEKEGVDNEIRKRIIFPHDRENRIDCLNGIEIPFYPQDN